MNIYSAIQVANYLISRSLGEGITLTPSKLQKLVYFAHGWCLAEYKKPLIDEYVQAWRSGPVISSLYYQFDEEYENQSIKDLGQVIIFIGGSFYDDTPIINLSDKKTIKLLGFVWRVYRGIDETRLNAITSAKGGPWDKVVTEAEEKLGFLPQSKEIENEIIKKHFKKQLDSLSTKTGNKKKTVHDNTNTHTYCSHMHGCPG